jgi:hypothetical protein
MAIFLDLIYNYKVLPLQAQHNQSCPEDITTCTWSICWSKYVLMNISACVYHWNIYRVMTRTTGCMSNHLKFLLREIILLAVESSYKECRFRVGVDCNSTRGLQPYIVCWLIHMMLPGWWPPQLYQLMSWSCRCWLPSCTSQWLPW